MVRDAQLIADLVERRSYETWEADGAKDYAARAAERVKEILENHKPQELSEAVIGELDALVAEAEASV